MGYLKSDEPFIVDGVKGTAELPGTGDDPLAFTELSDVGRGVAHACLSDADWTCETGYMVGERLTYNEALRMLEEASGAFPRLIRGQTTCQSAHSCCG
jgi:nucleoside-diphosphate-sugar epimerase